MDTGSHEDSQKHTYRLTGETGRQPTNQPTNQRDRYAGTEADKGPNIHAGGRHIERDRKSLYILIVLLAEVFGQLSERHGDVLSLR